MNQNNSIEGMLSSAFPMITGTRILDVGTGFGTVVSKLISNPAIKVTTVDPEAWSFETLKSSYSSEIRTGRLKLIKKRIENLELEEEFFDTAVAIGSLHHLKDPVQGIVKMEQMTKGSIVITDWNSKSAGIHNPHSTEDLESKEKSIKKHAKDNGYSVSDFEYWYMIFKKR